MADLKLDEKTKAALIGLMPFSQSGAIDFIPPVFQKLEVSDEFKAVFSQRAFSESDTAKVGELLKAETMETEKIREIVRRNIAGWRNLYDMANMTPIEYVEETGGGANKQIFNLLHFGVVWELFENGMKISGLQSFEKMGLESSPESTSEASRTESENV